MMSDDRAAPGEHEILILRWLLPESRSGYGGYFNEICNMRMLGYGRWGEGNYILGYGDAALDPSAPVERVLAFGSIAVRSGVCTATVHDKSDDTIEVQFALTGRASIEEAAKSAERYCYSYWQPGDPAPATKSRVRETQIDAANRYVLAIAPGDERIWLHDRVSGVNRLIPHMQFYSEVVRVAGIRDKQTVFNAKLLFSEDGRFTGECFRQAVIAYNKRRPVASCIDEPPAPPASHRGILARIFNRKG